jgi:hypothetical protein
MTIFISAMALSGMIAWAVVIVMVILIHMESK